jgi:lipopolysaccharide export LptBFGC system permease protein LptF
MRRLSASLLIIACLAICLTGCTSNNPKAVAQKFLLSVAKADLEEAKKVSDSTTRELLDQADYLNMVPDSVKAEGRKLKVTILDVKETGDKAVVTYNTSKLEEQQIITLAKIDGKWLVQLNKAEQYEEEPMMPGALEAIQQDSAILTTQDSATD